MRKRLALTLAAGALILAAGPAAADHEAWDGLCPQGTQRDHPEKWFVDASYDRNDDTYVCIRQVIYDDGASVRLIVTDNNRPTPRN